MQHDATGSFCKHRYSQLKLAPYTYTASYIAFVYYSHYYFCIWIWIYIYLYDMIWHDMIWWYDICIYIHTIIYICICMPKEAELPCCICLKGRPQWEVIAGVQRLIFQRWRRSPGRSHIRFDQWTPTSSEFALMFLHTPFLVQEFVLLFLSNLRQQQCNSHWKGWP